MNKNIFNLKHTGLACLLLILSLVTLRGMSQQRPPARPADKSTIVLVYGTYADGSSWNKVIPILQKEGYQTIAVQNPLTSLEADVAAFQRILSEVTGNVIMVAHSWGGVVITQAGNDEKVKALVYVAAYAPDEGQSVHSINREAYDIRKLPNNRSLLAPVNTDGYLKLKEETVIAHFAQDLPVPEARILAAVQGRLHISTIKAKVTNPAWKNKPSFFIVSDDDHIISPQLEAETAKKIKAVTYHLPASHVVMLARPEEVARVIVKAAINN